jgi:hypothetical protein
MTPVPEKFGIFRQKQPLKLDASALGQCNLRTPFPGKNNRNASGSPRRTCHYQGWSKMIPQNLHWAFDEGHRVKTLGGTGKMKRHSLADLVLPSGKISMGYPGDGFRNEPNENQQQVPPGTYPVVINVVRVNKESSGAFAFVAVSFTKTRTISWEAAGRFFTDSGDGCLFDTSVVDLLRKKKKELPREQWAQLKTAALYDGNGSLLLDEQSGANALVFKAGDWSYNCFIGRDSNGQTSSLVIDGRVHQTQESPFRAFLRSFMP